MFALQSQKSKSELLADGDVLIDQFLLQNILDVVHLQVWEAFKLLDCFRIGVYTWQFQNHVFSLFLVDLDQIWQISNDFFTELSQFSTILAQKFELVGKPVEDIVVSFTVWFECIGYVDFQTFQRSLTEIHQISEYSVTKILLNFKKSKNGAILKNSENLLSGVLSEGDELIYYF